jgi:uncharacterized membrane protein YjfL (UPF0719 family)
MKSVKINFNIETILQLAAIIVLSSILVKAIVDVDTNYDTWWYHLPFAARIWGIVPPDLYLAEDAIEYRYEGFPLLANFLQGFFWRITGRVQSANLVCFGSLIVYLYFLKAYCRIPLYLSTIALLTIPTVITHVTTCFVDLPGNVGVSILVMMTYLLYAKKELPTTKDILIIILAAAVAANIKPQLQPLTFVILCFTGLRIIWLNFGLPNFKSWLFKAIPLGLIASLLIFATPVKNIALYGNPFYPVKVQVAGIVLNHKLSPATYKEGSRPQKWFNSVFEINTPTWWSTDQWNGGNNKFMDRGGGFFGNYVIFNLILLLFFFIYQQVTNKNNTGNFKRATTTAAIMAIAMSVIPANFPQSHELRYFMFWAICLVSLNLYLITQYEQNFTQLKWLKSKYLGLVYALFLTIVLTKVGNFYAKPQFYSLQQQINIAVKPELLKQIQPGDRVCLIAKAGLVNPKAVPYAAMQHTFLYSAYFHPELNYSYSIKTRSTASKCEDRKIIP